MPEGNDKKKPLLQQVTGVDNTIPPPVSQESDDPLVALGMRAMSGKLTPDPAPPVGTTDDLNRTFRNLAPVNTQHEDATQAQTAAQVNNFTNAVNETTKRHNAVVNNYLNQMKVIGAAARHNDAVIQQKALEDARKYNPGKSDADIADYASLRAEGIRKETEEGHERAALSIDDDTIKRLLGLNHGGDMDKEIKARFNTLQQGEAYQQEHPNMSGLQQFGEGVKSGVNTALNAFSEKPGFDTSFIYDDQGSIKPEFKKLLYVSSGGELSKYADVGRNVLAGKLSEYDGSPTYLSEGTAATMDALHDVPDAIGAGNVSVLAQVLRSPYYVASGLLQGLKKAAETGVGAGHILTAPFTNDDTYAQWLHNLEQINTQSTHEDAADKFFGGITRFAGEIAALGNLAKGGEGTIANAVDRTAAKYTPGNVATAGGFINRQATPFSNTMSKLMTGMSDARIPVYSDNVLSAARMFGPSMYSDYYADALRKGYGEDEARSYAGQRMVTAMAAFGAGNFASATEKSIADQLPNAILNGVDKGLATSIPGKIGRWTKLALAHTDPYNAAIAGAGGGASAFMDAVQDHLDDVEHGRADPNKSMDIGTAAQKAAESALVMGITTMGLHLINGHGRLAETPQASALYHAVADQQGFSEAVARQVNRGWITPEQGETAQALVDRIAPEVQRQAGAINSGKIKPEMVVKIAIEKARQQDAANEYSRLQQQTNVVKTVDKDGKISDTIYGLDPDKAEYTRPYGEKVAAQMADIKSKADASEKALRQLEQGAYVYGRSVSGDELLRITGNSTPATGLTTEQAGRIMDNGPYVSEARDISQYAKDPLVKQYVEDIKSGKLDFTPQHANDPILATDGSIIDGHKRIAKTLADGFGIMDVMRPQSMPEIAQSASEEYDNHMGSAEPIAANTAHADVVQNARDAYENALDREPTADEEKAGLTTPAVRAIADAAQVINQAALPMEEAKQALRDVHPAIAPDAAEHFLNIAAEVKPVESVFDAQVAQPQPEVKPLPQPTAEQQRQALAKWYGNDPAVTESDLWDKESGMPKEGVTRDDIENHLFPEEKPVAEVPRETPLPTPVSYTTQDGHRVTNEGRPQTITTTRIVAHPDTKAVTELRTPGGKPALRKTVQAEFKDGLHVVDNAGNPVSGIARQKAIAEAAQSYDFHNGVSAGRIQPEAPIESNEDYGNHVLAHSSLPTEIAGAWTMQEAEGHSFTRDEQAILNHIGPITVGSSDHGELKNSGLLDDKGAGMAWLRKEGGTTLSSIAHAANEGLQGFRNVEGGDVQPEERVTPDDVLALMLRFPTGVRGVDKTWESRLSTDLANKFEKLTGFPLTPEIADIAAQQVKAGLTPFEQQLIDADYARDADEQRAIDEADRQGLITAPEGGEPDALQNEAQVSKAGGQPAGEGRAGTNAGANEQLTGRDRPTGQQASTVDRIGEPLDRSGTTHYYVDDAAITNAGWSKADEGDSAGIDDYADFLRSKFKKSNVAIVGNEQAAKLTGNLNPDAWVEGNTVFINIEHEHLRPTSLMEESAHLWIDFMRGHSEGTKAIHDKGIELAQGTPKFRYMKALLENGEVVPEGLTAAEVKECQRYVNAYKDHNDPLYSLANEILAKAIRTEGKELSSEPDAKKNFGKWLQSFWVAVKDAMGFGDMNTVKFAQLKLKDFARKAAEEIGSNRELTGRIHADEVKAYEEQAYSISEVSEPGKPGKKVIKVQGSLFDVPEDLPTFNSDEKEGKKSEVVRTKKGKPIPFRIFNANDDRPADNFLQREADKGQSGDFALVERQFTEYGGLSFSSAKTKIESYRDVAWLFRNLEDEAVEHSFAVHVRKDGTYMVQHLGTGGITGTVADIRMMIGAATKYGTKELHFIHNHPSGNLTSSSADRSVLSKIRQSMPDGMQVADGIIINLRSGRYITFSDYDNDWEDQPRSQEGEQKPVKVYSFSKQVFVQNYHPERVTGAQDVAAYISNQRFGVGDKPQLLILNQQHQIVGKISLNEPLLSAYDEIATAITTYGGVKAIMFGNDVAKPNTLSLLKERLKSGDMDLLDYVQVGGDVRNYISAADTGLLEPHVEYTATNEQKEVQARLTKAQDELRQANDALMRKRGEVGTSIKQDATDLFGERKATSSGLFDERVTQSGVDDTLKPYRDRVAKARKAVDDLQEEYRKQGGQTGQMSMFSLPPRDERESTLEILRDAAKDNDADHFHDEAAPAIRSAYQNKIIDRETAIDLHRQVMDAIGNPDKIKAFMEHAAKTLIPEAATEKESKSGDGGTSGIAERVKDVSGMSTEAGKGWSPEQANEIGKNLIKKGVKPQDVLDEFNANGGKVNGYMMAIANEHANELARLSDRAADEFGPNSKQSKAATQAQQDWLDKVQPMQTEWQKIGAAQQGETEIDTGSFTAMQNARAKSKGSPLTEGEKAEAAKRAGHVKKLQEENEALQKKVSDLLMKTAAEDAAKESKQAVSKKVKDAVQQQKRTPIPKGTDVNLKVRPNYKSNLEAALAFGKKGTAMYSLPERHVQILPDEAHKFVRGMVDDAIKAGMSDADEIMEKVAKDLAEGFPDVMARDVADIYSGYGKVKLPAADEISRLKREIKALSRLGSATEDVEQGLPPLRTGYQPGEKSLAIREKEERLRQLIRDNPDLITTDPEMQMKSAEDAARRALNNEIEALNKEIDTKTRREKPTTTPITNPEILALRAERDRLRHIRDVELGKPEMSDEQKMALIVKTLERANAAKRERIAKGDIEPNSKPESNLTNDKIEQLKKESEQLSQEIADMRKAANPPKTKEQLATDAAMRSTQKRIEELDDLISRRVLQQGKKTSLVQETPELKALRAERDQKQAEYDKIWDAAHPKRTKEEIATETAIKSTNRRIGVLEEMLDNNKLKGDDRQSFVDETNQLLIEARDKRDGLQKELDARRKAAKAATAKSPEEKATDAAIKAKQTQLDEVNRRIQEHDLAKAKKQSLVDKNNSDLQDAEDAVTSAKQTLAQMREVSHVEDLGEQFADKRDDKFTPQQASDIWRHMRIHYIENGIDINTAIANTATDLGISPKQVRAAVISPKVKPISDEMYKKQSQLRAAIQYNKDWANAENTPLALKAIRTIPKFFFAAKVFGHGTVGMITHAGANLFDPLEWKRWFPSFIKQFQFAYGSEAKYEQAMQDHINDPAYTFWKRNGLAVDPTKRYDDYQFITRIYERMGKLGRVLSAGDRGFEALKVYRLARAKALYQNLSKVEKADPKTAKYIADLVNNSTGTASLKVSDVANTVFFAPNLELSRWNRIVMQPAQAIATYSKFAKWDQVPASEKLRAKIVTQRAARMLATYVGALAVNQALLSLFGSKQDINFLDPTKSDWLRFKAGDQVIDPSGGMASTLTFLSSLAYIAFEPKENLGYKDRETQLFDKAKNYVVGKASPFASTAKDVLTQHDFSGNTLPWSDDKPKHKYNDKLTWFWSEGQPGYIERQQLPIPFSEAFNDIHDQMKSQGMDEANIRIILTGIFAGAASGSTGIRVHEDYRVNK